MKINRRKLLHLLGFGGAFGVATFLTRNNETKKNKDHVVNGNYMEAIASVSLGMNTAGAKLPPITCNGDPKPSPTCDDPGTPGVEYWGCGPGGWCCGFPPPCI